MSISHLTKTLLSQTIMSVATFYKPRGKPRGT